MTQLPATADAQADVTRRRVVLEERTREIAALTILLKEQEHSTDILARQNEWLREVVLSLLGLRGGWSLLSRRRRLMRVRKLLRIKRLFDGDEYIARFPDVGSIGADPLLHYLTHGMKEGRLR